ncbi:MAG: hypothetical protein ACO2Z9_10010 [Crocinitomicaceae bacterium]
MGQLMFDFEFEHIIRDSDDMNHGSGVYLWVFHADKIPPHIGISSQGKFYSLKSSGVDIGLDTGKVFRLVSDKKLPSILIRLNSKVSKAELDRIYQGYSKTQAGSITCLTPVNEVLSIGDVAKLSELLTSLKKNGRLSQVYGFHLSAQIKGIRAYSAQDVTNRLLALQNDSK